MSHHVVYGFLGASLAAAASLVGCAVEGTDPPLGSISSDAQVLVPKGGCPAGWIDEDYLRVFCPQDMVLVSRLFGHTSCVQCAPADEPGSASVCEGTWRNAGLMFGCAPGFELEYSSDGACKRCVAAADGDAGDECVSHEDCFRTGCSGEVCAAEETLSLCIWRPEHACYEDRFCGCQKGRCGFKRHPELLRCLADAREGD